MTSMTYTRMQDAALDLANLALVGNVPTGQFQAAVERYRIAKLGHSNKTEGK